MVDASTPTSSLAHPTHEERPGPNALLDYAPEGDAIVVVSIDRLGRWVMATIRELGETRHRIALAARGIDTATVAAGRQTQLQPPWVSRVPRSTACWPRTRALDHEHAEPTGARCPAVAAPVGSGKT